MENLRLKHKSSIELKNILCIICLTLVLVISYHYNISYNFLVFILKCALCTLTVVLMLNSGEKQKGYVFFIGIGYIFVNIYEFVGVIYGKRQLFSADMIVDATLIELVVFIIAINYISKNDIINKYLLKIIVFSLLMIAITCRFSSNAVILMVLLNLLLIMYMYIRGKNNENEISEEFDNVKKMLMLRTVHCVCIFIYSFIGEQYYIIKVLSDTASIIQIYLIYKIIIKKNLINPYLDILQNNEKIEHQNIVESNANVILEKMKELQEGINEKLVYKEELYQSILESTPNGIVIFDKDGEIKEYNESFRKIVNSKGDMLDDISKNIMDYSKFIKNAVDVCKEKISIDDEIITNKNKIYKCSYYFNSKDESCVCNLLDITQEKNISKQLLNLKEEYEDLINNVGVPVYIFDGEENIINYTKSYKEFFDQIDLYLGEDNENIDIDEKNTYKIFEDDLDIYNESRRMTKKAKDDSELNNDGYLRYRVIDHLGNILWIESRTKIFYDHNKKFILKSYDNITEYIKAKEYLKKTNKLYESLLDSVPEAIYLEDLDNNTYAFVNKKFKDIFDINDNVSELGLCRQDLMRVHPEYEDISLEGLVRIKDNKISDYENIKYINMSGEIIDSKSASIPFMLDNKVYKLTIIKDMNDIKNLENLRVKIQERRKIDKMKMEFFVNMSHELKTPLNLIFTSTQLIENLLEQGKINDFDNKISKHVSLTNQNSYRLLKIISDLIDFTKMESGYYKLRMENKNIVSLVEDITMSVVTYAKSKDINLIFDTEIEELVMSVDINAIERILLNILSNAIKFTESGGNIYVNLFERDNKIDIEIKDTGIGIEEDKINLIFERFNNVNKGFIGNVYGSGIGLSMVKSMINLIQGEVKVESKYGEGTKFTITLNINELNQCNSIQEKEYYNKNNSNVERLIVDMTDIYN